jgi:hypothetical protein
MATIITFPLPHFGTMQLDACLSQQHTRTADITRHRVEQGSDVTDHVRPSAYSLSVNGIIAYAPPRNPLDVALGAVFDANRTGKAFERLHEAIDRSELVTVDTGLRLYKNMAIRSIDSPRETATGSDFVFTLQLEEVRFVEAATIKIPLASIGKALPGLSGVAAVASKAKTQIQAAAKVVKGAAPKVAAAAPQAAKAASMASKLLGYGR